MPIDTFRYNSQPLLSNICYGLNIRTFSPYNRNLISGAVILADELFTNVDNNVKFISLILIFHNLEGAARTINYTTLAGNILLVNTVNTALSFINTSQIVFDKFVNTAALINASTTLYFSGYRVTIW